MNKAKIILGIETSCDETAAAVVQKDKDGVKILSNIVASSADLQAKYGGIIPEQAAREQLKSIIPVIQEALSQAFPSVIPAKVFRSLREPEGSSEPRIARGPQDRRVRDDIEEKIEAIAVTQGPGLIGSLLVGVETAKVLSTIWQKPLIPVNHLMGHFYANWITSDQLPTNLTPGVQNFRTPGVSNGVMPSFPCLGLLVSGGHTDLVLLKNHGKYEYIGGTRDDAAGEAFDKTARLMGLPYPGGPHLSKLAETGNPSAFKLPRPMLDSNDFDFSFSGLKTAVMNIMNTEKRGMTHDGAPVLLDQWVNHGAGDGQNPEQFIRNMAASVQEAIVDVLVKKTIRAAKEYNIEHIIIAGGVAANRKLKERLQETVKKEISRGLLFIPPPHLCTDNAAYIATAALFNFHPSDPLTLQANPNLSLSPTS